MSCARAACDMSVPCGGRRAAVGTVLVSTAGTVASCRHSLTSISALLFLVGDCTEQFVPFVVSGYSLTAASNTQELLEDKRKAAVCLSLPSPPTPHPHTLHTPTPLLSSQAPTTTRLSPVSFAFTILSMTHDIGSRPSPFAPPPPSFFKAV